MNKFSVFCPIIFFYISLFGQAPIVIGETHKIQSAVLNEEREISIQLPKHYNDPNFDKASYPVLYVLDGEFHFQLVASIERFNTDFLYRPHPEMIIVGIKNTDRTRDLTPTNFVIEDKNGETRFKSSGGADNFIKFISEELKPFINSNFRTSGYDILHGHSFSGLFTVYTLTKHPELFKSYIAIDPSLWWDNRYVFKQAEKRFAENRYKGNRLFVALAHEDPENAKDRFRHGETIKHFCKMASDSNRNNSLDFFLKKYPEYNHGTVSVPATMDALIILFEGIELPVKKVPNNPNLVKETFEKVSEKLRFNFYPDESLLYNIIKYTKEVGNETNAKVILNYALEIYPKSKQLQLLQKN
ncbi:MAG: alpha/beta hydrolase [Flavobacteriales bacterium]